MKEYNPDISKKTRVFKFKNPEYVVVITDNVPDGSFSRGCRIDVLVVKKEIWENNETLRTDLLPCLVEKESQLILI